MARVTVREHAAAEAGEEVAELLDAVGQACAAIAATVRVAGLSDVLGAAGDTNVQGEAQQKLDVFANDEMMRVLGEVKSVAALVSEEDDEAVFTGHEAGKYAVIFDPLDGSSKIDVNVNTGTIFSVQPVAADNSRVGLDLGSQVAAGYVVYGPSTIMVLTTGKGVAAFTLDDMGVWIRTAAGMQMPEQGLYYSANEANAADWPGGYREFVAMLVAKKLNGKSYGARYVGSLVADFHRTLLKGGIFFYPPTAKAPDGKLRLLYEAAPMAMIAEQAGGMATSGVERILDAKPEKIHQRTGLVVGGRAEVSALQELVERAR